MLCDFIFLLSVFIYNYIRFILFIELKNFIWILVWNFVNVKNFFFVYNLMCCYLWNWLEKKIEILRVWLFYKLVFEIIYLFFRI